MRPVVRGTISFFAVLAAYWGYCLFAVPWIEPAATERDSSITFSDHSSSGWTSRLVAELRPLFPPGAKELENPKILEDGPVRLLFDKYENHGDGEVLIWPCTIVYTPDDPRLSKAERVRRSVVMQAPQGAVLEFDERLNLFRGKFGKFRGGRLRGRIIIRSDMQEAGPGDDLWIETRDVQLTDTQIYTQHDVSFRLGPNHGRGRQMLLRLVKREATTADPELGNLNVKGLEQFEIQQLDHLHLQPAQKRDGKATSSLGRLPLGADPSESDLPIEISCKGAFVFDPVKQKATFERDVLVLRLHPDGPDDEITCEMLTVQFARSREGIVDPTRAQDAESAGGSALLSLRPSRIAAVGMPVDVQMPGENVVASGQRMEYDVRARRITLEGVDPVMIQRDEDVVHAQRIIYESPLGNPVGLLDADGPGWLRGRTDPDSEDSQTFYARWDGTLTLRPSGGEHVLSATQGITAEYGAMGSLSADELYFWCREAPKPPDQAGLASSRSELRLVPARALIQGRVDMQSSQLDCHVERLEMWFKQRVAITGNPYYYGQQRESGPFGPARAGQDFAAPRAGRTSRSKTPDSHFKVEGELLQVGFLIDGSKTELEQLAVKERVRLTETRTAEPGERPVLLTGHELHASRLTADDSEMIIVGTPAHFEGRGLGMTGSNICLNRGVNRLWVNGAGQMDLPQKPEAAASAAESASPFIVRWTHHMEFDGLEAQFHGDVVARVEDAETRRRLETPLLKVFLNRRIDFDQTGESADPARLSDLTEIQRSTTSPVTGQAQRILPERIECSGGVFMESFAFEGPLQTSREQVEVDNLTIRFDTGDVTSTGGGWLKSVRRGSMASMLADGAVASALQSEPTDSQSRSADEFTYCNLRFHDSLKGNIETHEVRVAGQVHCILGPVEHWDAEIDETELESADPRTVMLTCHELVVLEMPIPGSEDRSVELIATGNTVIEGGEFTARGERVSYAELKDLLILEGSDRSEAVLFRQPYIGAPRSNISGRRIYYRPSTNHSWIAGARGMDLTM